MEMAVDRARCDAGFARDHRDRNVFDIAPFEQANDGADDALFVARRRLAPWNDDVAVAQAAEIGPARLRATARAIKHGLDPIAIAVPFDELGNLVSHRVIFR